MMPWNCIYGFKFFCYFLRTLSSQSLLGHNRMKPVRSTFSQEVYLNHGRQSNTRAGVTLNVTTLIWQGSNFFSTQHFIASALNVLHCWSSRRKRETITGEILGGGRGGGTLDKIWHFYAIQNNFSIFNFLSIPILLTISNYLQLLAIQVNFPNVYI